MDRILFSRCTNRDLLTGWNASLARERAGLADSLGYLAEIDARRLYVEHGYPSLFQFCLGKGDMDEGAAYKRIAAARAVQRFPALLECIENGHLHLSAVVLLAPHLTAANFVDLVAGATRRTKQQIEVFLAHRFPKADVPTTIRTVPTPAAALGLAPGTEALQSPATDAGSPAPVANTTPGELSPGIVAPVAHEGRTVPMVPDPPPARVKPLAPERFELRMTLDQEAHDLLREAQALLAAQVPDRDAALVLKRVLQDWVAARRRRTFGLTDKPRARRSTGDGRYVPAAVRREVMRRDGERCTFVSADGHRCEAREHLQFDHVQPVARGGKTCADNLRLRCRAHNQYEAERVYGAGFMRARREAPRSAATSPKGPREPSGDGAPRKVPYACPP